MVSIRVGYFKFPFILLPIHIDILPWAMAYLIRFISESSIHSTKQLSRKTGKKPLVHIKLK